MTCNLSAAEVMDQPSLSLFNKMKAVLKGLLPVCSDRTRTRFPLDFGPCISGEAWPRPTRMKTVALGSLGVREAMRGTHSAPLVWSASVRILVPLSTWPLNKLPAGPTTLLLPLCANPHSSLPHRMWYSGTALRRNPTPSEMCTYWILFTNMPSYFISGFHELDALLCHNTELKIQIIYWDNNKEKKKRFWLNSQASSFRLWWLTRGIW